MVAIKKLRVRANKSLPEASSEWIKHVSRFGFQNPPIVSRNQQGAYLIEDGHKRISTAKAMGAEEILCNVIGPLLTLEEMAEMRKIVASIFRIAVNNGSSARMLKAKNEWIAFCRKHKRSSIEFPLEYE